MIKPDIRVAQTTEELTAVYRFRYAVYVEEMARPQKYADHEAKLVFDPLDVPAARVLAAWEAGEVVGTVRSNLLRSSEIGEYANQYSLTHLSAERRMDTSITTRLMVHPRHRRTTLAIKLSCEAYRGGLENGIATDFIDCNSHLIDYFHGLGYRPYLTNVTHPEYGEVTVMRLDLTEIAHLKSIRSPFCRVYDEWMSELSPLRVKDEECVRPLCNLTLGQKTRWISSSSP